MSGTYLMKRIPRIKFPQRHPSKPSSGSPVSDQKLDVFRLGSTSNQKTHSSSANVPSYRFRSEVPSPPTNTAIGGKASMLPKRTPVSEKEIEAILLGGNF